MKFKSHVLAAFIFFFARGVLNFANGDEFDFEVLASIKDMHKGTPASNIPVTLYKLTNNDEWALIGKEITGNNGHVQRFRSNVNKFTAATYKLQYNVKEYHEFAGVKTFFPLIEVTFFVNNPSEGTAIETLMDAFGYTTYRGLIN